MNQNYFESESENLQSDDENEKLMISIVKECEMEYC